MNRIAILEAQNLLLKLKNEFDQSQYEEFSKQDIEVFINLMTLQQGSNFIYLSALSSIIRIQNEELDLFDNQYLRKILETLIQFQQNLDSSLIEVFVVKKLQFLQNLFQFPVDEELFIKAWDFLNNQVQFQQQQNQRDSISRITINYLKDNMKIDKILQIKHIITSILTQNLNLKQQQEQIFHILNSFLNLVQQQQKYEIYKNIINQEMIYFVISIDQDNIQTQNLSLQFFESYLILQSKIQSSMEISILFGQLFQKKLNKIYKSLQEKTGLKNVDELMNLLQWFFKLSKYDILIRQNFNLFQKPIIQKFIKIVFKIGQFQEIQINIIKMILQNFDFSKSVEKDLDSITSMRHKWKKLAQDYNEEPIKFKKRNIFNNEQWVLFLKHNQYIDPQKMSEILGASKFIEILECYLKSFDFTDLPVNQAQKILFSNFLMFGEAQNIENVIDIFSKQYHKQNPTSFENTDSTYVFIYALIMLNTDLHNPNMETKMSFEQFQKNCKKINNGKDLLESYLRQSYNEIKNEEIKTLIYRDLIYENKISKNIYTYQQKHQNIDYSIIEKDYEQIVQNIDFEKTIFTIWIKAIIKNFSQIQNSFQNQALVCFLEKISEKISDDKQIVIDFFNVLKKENLNYTLYLFISKLFLYLPVQDSIQFIIQSFEFRQQIYDKLTFDNFKMIDFLKKQTKILQQEKNKNSIYNLLANFLEDDSSEEELLENQNFTNYLNEIINQTRFLNNEEIYNIQNQLLESKSFDSLSIYFEIAGVNKDRLELFIQDFKVLQKIEDKQKQSFVNYKLMLIICNILNDKIVSIIPICIEYLSQCSSQVIIQFLSCLNLKIHSEGAMDQLQIDQILQILIKIFQVYQENSYNDYELIFDILKSLQHKICFHQETLSHLKIYLQFLNDIDQRSQISPLQILNFIEQIIQNYELSLQNVEIIEKNEVFLELFSYLIQQNLQKNSFMLHNQLIQKTLASISFQKLNLQSIQDMFKRLKSQFVSQNDQEIYHQYIYIMNKIVILCIECEDLEQIWSLYILQIDKNQIEFKEVIDTQIQYLKDKLVVNNIDNGYFWAKNNNKLEIPHFQQ